MSILELNCPSGLKGRIRGLKVKDERLFADKRLIESGKLLTTLLNNCWVETLDIGPYAQTTGGFDWQNAVSADRTYAMLQLRIASYGPTYAFNVTCNNDNCRAQYVWELDLQDLEIKPIDPVALNALKTQQPFSVTANNVDFSCRLLTGVDELMLHKMTNKDRTLLSQCQLAKHVVAIKGVKASTDREILEALEDLDAVSADALRDKLDELAGSVETVIGVSCDKCGTEQQVELPFEASFFSSRKRFAPSR